MQSKWPPRAYNNNNHYLRAATNPSPDLRPWDAPRCIIRSHSEWGQRTPQHGDSYHRPSLAEGSTAHARWVNDRTTTRSRTGGPIPAPSLYCVLRTFTHTPHHTGWHTRRSMNCCRRRTGSFVLWGRSQAAGDPTADQGGTDLSAIRERVVTLHRPLRGVGALPLTEVSDSVDN